MTCMVGYPKDPVKDFPTSDFGAYAKYGATGFVSDGSLTIEEVCNHTAPYAQVLAHIDEAGDPAVGMPFGPMEFVPDLRLEDGVMARWGEARNTAPPSRGAIFANYAMPVPDGAAIVRVQMAVWIKRSSPTPPGTGWLLWSSDGNYTTELAGTEFNADDAAEDWVRYVFTLPSNQQQNRAWLATDFHACYAGVLMYGGGFIGPQIIVEYEEEDGIMSRVGSAKKLFTDKTETPAAARVDIPFGTRLVINHTMATTTTGGYVSVANVHKCAPSAEVSAPHHGGGTNIPTAARTASYSCVYKDCAEAVDITLNITDGTHNVSYELLSCE